MPTMINARRVTANATYNNAAFPEEAGKDIESITYIDSASDNSDSVDITFNASDPKWLKNWLPVKGAKIKPNIIGRNWDSRTGRGDYTLKCGLFILDDLSFTSYPSKMSVGGVAKPANQDFSELKREKVWKYTSIKRIGKNIANRYGLKFTYDAEDYSIEINEQDATDSSFLNSLCKDYGLVLKVYNMRMWIYDREKYKKKKPVKTYSVSDMKQGSFNYSTTLYGTYTGGYFNYTDGDKDIDIIASIGGGSHTKNVSRRASSVLDASIQLCADLNNANHGKTKIRFSTDGEWKICSGNTIQITGYGKLDGKYFVDKITHKYSSSGFTSDIEASLVEKPFNYWDVGGHIEVHEKDDEEEEAYTSTYENMKSEAAGAQPGQAVTLNNAPFYVSSTAPEPACYKSGTFYFYDGVLQGGRYRMTISADRCGKLPVGENVTGWVPAAYCGVGAAQEGNSTAVGGGSSSGGSSSGSGSSYSKTGVPAEGIVARDGLTAGVKNTSKIDAAMAALEASKTQSAKGDTASKNASESFAATNKLNAGLNYGM